MQAPHHTIGDETSALGSSSLIDQPASESAKSESGPKEVLTQAFSLLDLAETGSTTSSEPTFHSPYASKVMAPASSVDDRPLVSPSIRSDDGATDASFDFLSPPASELGFDHAAASAAEYDIGSSQPASSRSTSPRPIRGNLTRDALTRATSPDATSDSSWARLSAHHSDSDDEF